MKKLIRLTGLIIIAAMIAAVLPGCGSFGDAENDGPQKYSEYYYDYFDTVIQLVAYCDSQEDFDAISAYVNEGFDKYNRLFDIYNDYEGVSNVKTINDNAGKEPVEVSPELLDFLDYCTGIYSLTGGRVNVAMGSVLRLWHNAREYAETHDDPYVPDKDELEEAALHTYISLLETDRQAGTAYLSDPKASLDVGAIAKGYAVERVAEGLEEKGLTNIAINAGGNVRTIGPKPDASWKIGITDPDKSNSASIDKIWLDGLSVVTSGVYERYFTAGGVRYHHIIDPDTLFPEDRYLSVSIIAKDSALADGLSTGVFNMDFDEGLAFIEGLEGVEAMWIMPDRSLKWSSGYEAFRAE